MLKAAYVLSWSVAFGVAIVFVTFPLAVFLDRNGILYEDWGVHTWPLGIVLGCWFALRSENFHRFHQASVVIGSCAAAVCGFAAAYYRQESQRLLGVRGPLSGFGELLASWMYVALAVVAVCIVLGSVAIIVRRRLPINEHAAPVVGRKHP